MFGLEIWQILAAIIIAVFSGFVKGAIGFAMPMIMLSALGSVMSATTAIACLIMPTLVTNIFQAFRQGPQEAVASLKLVRWHVVMVVIFMCVSAPFARILPQPIMYMLLGVPIVIYSLWQLSGRPLALHVRHQRKAEVVTGIIGGLYGGVSGIWGPPLIVYLMTAHVGKTDQVRIQGIVFLIGAVVMVIVHSFTGLLNANTLALSLILVVPSCLGLFLGFALQDRLDVVQFRRWTQILLVVTGLNLIRRAIEIGF